VGDVLGASARPRRGSASVRPHTPEHHDRNQRDRRRLSLGHQRCPHDRPHRPQGGRAGGDQRLRPRDPGLREGEAAARPRRRRGKRNDQGDFETIELAEGDRILYQKYTGQEVTVGTEDYIIIRFQDVLAKLEESATPAGAAAGAARGGVGRGPASHAQPMAARRRAEAI
jgi:hypothetical protein